jgi:hypothetical protein
VIERNRGYISRTVDPDPVREERVDREVTLAKDARVINTFLITYLLRCWLLFFISISTFIIIISFPSFLLLFLLPISGSRIEGEVNTLSVNFESGRSFITFALFSLTIIHQENVKLLKLA